MFKSAKYECVYTCDNCGEYTSSSLEICQETKCGDYNLDLCKKCLLKFVEEIEELENEIAEIEDDREHEELAQMMDMVHQQQGGGGGYGDESFADGVLGDSQGLKIFSSIFMDIKDPLLCY